MEESYTSTLSYGSAKVTGRLIAIGHAKWFSHQCRLNCRKTKHLFSEYNNNYSNTETYMDIPKCAKGNMSVDIFEYTEGNEIPFSLQSEIPPYILFIQLWSGKASDAWWRDIWEC
ncbi:hypothetical protein J6590_055795 [Homalodisca vitripennis]|nr:hypothetical protein J6590_055795 [Homalodisca vitripennis]